MNQLTRTQLDLAPLIVARSAPNGIRPAGAALRG